MRLSSYDAWLERPYVLADRRAAEYERFCETNGLEPDDDDSWSAFEDWQDEIGEAE